jgi:hypothetical protein
VLDGVGMVWVSFFEELLKVVCGQSCLTLAAAHGLCSALCTGAACTLVGAIIIVGCGLLVALLVPLLSGLGALLRTLDGAGW